MDADEIKKLIITLEQGKKLKELGVDQKSMFFYNWNNTAKNPTVEKHKAMIPGIVIEDKDYNIFVEIEKNVYDGYLKCSAYTVGEFGIMLGRGTKAAEAYWHHILNKINGGNSSTIVYDPVWVADAIIKMINAGNLNIDEINQRMRKFYEYEYEKTV